MKQQLNMYPRYMQGYSESESHDSNQQAPQTTW